MLARYSRCLARRITLTASLLFLITAPAHALDVGHCDTPEGLSAKLKEEGHKIVATMERMGVSLKRGGKRHDIAELVTATPDLKRWYIISGDEPLSKRSTEMCVSGSGRNLEINDYRKNGVPTVTRYRFDREKALAECDRVGKTFVVGEDTGVRCNEFNEGVRILEEDLNERIALQGISDHGSLMTVVADPDDDRDFRMLATGAEGATLITGRGFNFSFSGLVLNLLDKRGTD